MLALLQQNIQPHYVPQTLYAPLAVTHFRVPMGSKVPGFSPVPVAEASTFHNYSAISNFAVAVSARVRDFGPLPSATATIEEVN